jgi:hypothetical protein
MAIIVRSISRFFVAAAVMFSVAGCKPEDIEVRISSEDIAEAIDGGTPTVTFEARFSKLGDMEDDQ